MLEKAARGERARIEELIAREEARVRRAFRRFLDDVQSDAVRRQVRLALERGGTESALRVVDAHVARLGTVVAQVFQSAGTAEAAAIGRNLRGARARVAISFDPTYPRAASAMRRNTLSFVREMTRAQRESTRAALVEALQTGAGTVQTARALRDSLGLTETQRRSVGNYRRLLEAGDAAALDRGLRDRRFDSSVRRASEDGEPLGGKKIDRMVAQYRNRYLQYRAESIARTETLRTVGQARRESLLQVLEQVEIPKSSAVRTWATTRDGRERDTHADADGQQAGMEEPFELSSGARLMFPGDDSLGAPAEEVINCLLPGAVIDAPDLIATARAPYDGQGFTIVTTGGRKITITANHPVLTIGGWVPAKHLTEGDNLICYNRNVDLQTTRPGVYADQMPTRIEDLYESAPLLTSFKVVRGMNFHGDVVDGQIEIKLQAGCLLLYTELAPDQFFFKRGFLRGHVSSQFAAGNSPLNFAPQRILLTAAASVGCFGLGLPLILSTLRVFDKLCFALGAWPYSTFEKDSFYCPIDGVVALGKCIDRLAGLVELDQVIAIRTFPFRGHVYSPQTLSHIYTANGGIINHNCRCTELYEILED